MPRNRRAITFSLPPDMDEQVRQFIQEEDRTMSEFLREAIRLYMDEQQWLRGENAANGRRPAGGIRNDQGGRIHEPDHRLHPRSPLRQGLQR